jgi:hypothetical protein
MLTRHVSYMGKVRCAIWGCVSLLLNMHKKNVYIIFLMRCSLRYHVTVLVATNTQRICPNGHNVGAAQEAPRGEQAV